MIKSACTIRVPQSKYTTTGWSLHKLLINDDIECCVKKFTLRLSKRRGTNQKLLVLQKKCLAEGVQEVETTARTVHFQPTTLPATQHANITEPHAVLRFWTNSHKTQCSAEGSASRRTLTVTNRNQTIGHVCFWKTWGQTQSMSRCKRGYCLRDAHKKRGDRRGVVLKVFHEKQLNYKFDNLECAPKFFTDKRPHRL